MPQKTVVTIVGARPQFIKAAAVSRAIARMAGSPLRELLVHTGQHHDENMSEVFFRELSIPAPALNLGIAGGTHGRMTGRMLEEIEKALVEHKPDWLLIYGDTNSTLAGALAASKLHIPVAHVEAGLRSFDRRMPEEVNRVVADHLSTLLFAPTDVAVQNLRTEGIVGDKVRRVGDVMFDVMLFYRDVAARQSTILQRLELVPKTFVLATVHRAENTDDPARLRSILGGLAAISEKHTVVLPIHPRTRAAISARSDFKFPPGLRVIDPVGYLDMLSLEWNAGLIATDSGGVQKEAFFASVPCITLRDNTEWVELIHSGANVLVGADAARIAAEGLRRFASRIPETPLYGDGHAAEQIAAALA
ncbi:MAG: UDP-N-acetylglucosamine 2-epimerase (non-hydrolyzing) [Phycisphaerales bacterium]|nr:UDP-N-acetylglucosamine 2-epimerase (non-hydrolyzing) [Planctomycetota bacterium]